MPYNIYQFVEENGGGDIITYDSDPALTVSNVSLGVGVNLISNVTTALNALAPVVGGNTIAPVARFTSSATLGNAVFIGRNVAGSPTIAPLVLGVLSAASAVAIEFAGAYVSVTSLVLTTVSNFDYVIRVRVGNTYRSIPLIADAGVVGSAAF